MTAVSQTEALLVYQGAAEFIRSRTVTSSVHLLLLTTQVCTFFFLVDTQNKAFVQSRVEKVSPEMKLYCNYICSALLGRKTHLVTMLFESQVSGCQV